MTLSLERLPRLTYKVDLPGGQGRLREAILYVCKQCETAPSFGLTKLNKILWLADFSSFAERGQPVTGRTYQRLEHGPAPVEMLPMLTSMQRHDEIYIEGSGIPFEERRPKALVSPILRNFSPADLAQVNRSVERLWPLTAGAVSDISHGVAWKTRSNGDLMPYELAYFSDQPLGKASLAKLMKIGKENGWHSE